MIKMSKEGNYYCNNEVCDWIVCFIFFFVIIDINMVDKLRIWLE